MNTATYELNETIARKVLETVDAGLVAGLGEPIPGKCCVEAAVCYAMGLPHSDRPTCVGDAVRSFKIRLNDAKWSSNEARTQGMRKLAIAQLGSDSIDQKAFAKIVAKQTIRKILPIALRAAASRLPDHAKALEVAAKRCEDEGTGAAAREARKVSAYAYADAAADSPAYTASYTASYAAADADDYGNAAAFAAAFATAAATAAATADGDSMLNISAQIGLDALIELKSPGCEYLWLCQ